MKKCGRRNGRVHGVSVGRGGKRYEGCREGKGRCGVRRNVGGGVIWGECGEVCWGVGR